MFSAVIGLPFLWFCGPWEAAYGPARLTIPAELTGVAILVVLLVVRAAAGLKISAEAGTRRSVWRHTIPRRLALVATSIFLCLAVAEFTLKTAGIETELPPVVIRGRDTDGGRRRGNGLISDPVLRWKLKPGEEVWAMRINSLGFRDREVAIEKPPETVRVLCMGDSCTAEGDPPYSLLLHRQLNASPPTSQAWEAVNMGVFGYSIVQGLKTFEKKGMSLKPDFVTLYYGWNDHWLGGRLPDSKRMAREVSPWQSVVHETLRRRRVGQLALRLGASAGDRATERQEGCFRVPPEEYRDTLNTFVARIRASGGVPILITAPRARTLARELVINGQIRSVEDGIRAHDLYIDITREVASEKGSALLDLAETFSAADMAHLFKADGVHLTQEGHDHVKDQIYAKVLELSSEP